MSILRTIGTLLRPVRPGLRALTSTKLDPALGSTISVRSPEFTDGGKMPARYTQDGVNLFPPLAWTGLPAGTQSVVLLVEDADIPFLRPVTHCIVHSIPAALGKLDEGEVPLRQRTKVPHDWQCGRNFLGRPGWTAPAPPPGHGPHRYAFQIFALDARPQFPYPPGRGGLMRRIRPHLLAQGRLIGTYERR